MPGDSAKQGVRTSLSGHRSVRESAMNRLGGGGRKPMSSLAGRLVMLTLASVVLLGVSMTIILYKPGTSDDVFRPADSTQYNFRPLDGSKSLEPGKVVAAMQGSGIEIDFGVDAKLPTPVAPVIGISSIVAGANDPDVEPEEGPSSEPRKFSSRVAEEIARQGGELKPELLEQAKVIDTFNRKAMFTLDVKVREDVFAPTAPSLSVNEHLFREVYQAQRILVEGGDPKKGPFLFPPMMETPRIAFDGLVRDVAAADADVMVKASLGETFVHFDQPHCIEAARGYVFEASGRLWMLREQPLRKPVTVNGAEIKSAYFGIIAQIREGLEYERGQVHDQIAFTALSLPPELAKYAIKAGDFPSNEDSLAKEVVGVKVTGAWFRRIAYIEKCGSLEVELPQDLDPTVMATNAVRDLLTEAYMPWLVGKTASVATFELPDPKACRTLALMYSESDSPVRTVDKDRFDEAAYYALLAHAASGSRAFSEMPKADITLRDLGTQQFRNQYRGARVGFAGFLLDTYHPLVFPPNISGRRHGYRTFVADANTKGEARTELTWYVDVIEPPLGFRGSPRVEVDGHYVRSQIFHAKVGDKAALLTLPIVVAGRIGDPTAAPATGDGSYSTVHLVIVAGSVLSILLAIVFLTRRERRRSAAWQAEVLRQAQERRKAKGATVGGGSATGASSADASDEA